MADRWLVITHEASNSGAPRMLLEILRHVRSRRGSAWECEIICDHGGPLLEEFSRLGRVRQLAHPWAEGSGLGARLLRRVSRRLPFKPRRFAAWVAEWQAQGGGTIYSNTGTNGRLLAALPPGSAWVVSHVHELADGLRRFSRPAELAATLARTDRFLAVSAAVADDLGRLGVPESRIRRASNFLTAMPRPLPLERAREVVCRQLGLPPETKLVTGCGHIDPIKGTDLFVEVARAIKHEMTSPPVFLWLGSDRNPRFARQVRKLARKAGASVRFVGEVTDPAPFFAASEVVLITSRVESFGLVALEAGAAGRPVLAFSMARGLADLLSPESLVSDVDAMVRSLHGLLLRPGEAQRRGDELRQRIAGGFLADNSIGGILDAIENRHD